MQHVDTMFRHCPDMTYAVRDQGHRAVRNFKFISIWNRKWLKPKYLMC